MHSKFVSLYHLFKLYDAIKQIKFSSAHIIGDIVEDDFHPTNEPRFVALASALGRVDIIYLEGLIEETIQTCLGMPPSQSEAALVIYFNAWAKTEGFKDQSAEDILARSDLTVEQRTWIESYISQWRKANSPAFST